MNCIDCKNFIPTVRTTYYRVENGNKWGVEYLVDAKPNEIREPKEGEIVETEVRDGGCPVIGNHVFDNWDGVSVSPYFGCKFFEQK